NTYQAELIYNHRLVQNRMQKSGIQTTVQQNITNTTDLRLFLPNYTNKSVGIYHMKSIILKRTQMDLGLRYDIRHLQVFKYSNKHLIKPSHVYHAFSASYSLEHTFSKKWSFTYTSAFVMRPPAINELFSDGVHHGESIFIKNIKDDFDFGTENSLSSTLTLRHATIKSKTHISLFYNKIHNFISLKPTEPIVSIRGAFPTYYYHQGGAHVMGLDISIQWQLSKMLTIYNKGSITMGREQYNGTYLLNMPVPQVSSTLKYGLGQYRWLTNNEIELGYAYFFKQIFFPDNIYELNYNTVEGPKSFVIVGDYLPAPKGYGLVHAGANTHIPLGKSTISLFLSFNNLFNVRYRNYLNRMRYYADEQGFNCSLTAKISF
ncbi:MAG TPA: hypothetical protein VL947_00900, partial [Cytophagales bacterium]|nr:hypothetical protein [Cytophagales bacterium]